jgi:hypothetical protein
MVQLDRFPLDWRKGGDLSYKPVSWTVAAVLSPINAWWRRTFNLLKLTRVDV